VVGKKTIENVLKREGQNGFLLLKPRMIADADKVARAIAMCNGVKEVYITSGEYAFMVELDPIQERSISKIKRDIEKLTKYVQINVATNHYTYKTR
jgi:DNA-binding Lrp family transcriptional regulator